MENYQELLPTPFTNAKIIGNDVDPEAYHQPNAQRGDPQLVVGRSDLVEVWNNPHRWRMGYERQDSDSTDWGNLMDAKVMAPAKFKERFAIQPATYPDKDGTPKPWHGGSSWCKQWLADHADKQTIKAEDNKLSDDALRSLYGDPEAKEFVKCSSKQVMVSATYETTVPADDSIQLAKTKLSIPVKILIDLLPAKEHEFFGKSIGDFKTCANAHVGPWSRDVFKYGYHVQAAFYLDVYRAAAPDEERLEFRHILLESEAPWEVGKRILTQEFLVKGQERYLEALELYAWCLAANRWPNYDRPMPGRSVLRGWTLIAPEPWM